MFRLCIYPKIVWIHETIYQWDENYKNQQIGHVWIDLSLSSYCVRECNLNITWSGKQYQTIWQHRNTKRLFRQSDLPVQQASSREIFLCISSAWDWTNNQEIPRALMQSTVDGHILLIVLILGENNRRIGRRKRDEAEFEVFEVICQSRIFSSSSWASQASSRSCWAGVSA